jgi:hypothetical protein
VPPDSPEYSSLMQRHVRLFLLVAPEISGIRFLKSSRRSIHRDRIQVSDSAILALVIPRGWRLDSSHREFGLPVSLQSYIHSGTCC